VKSGFSFARYDKAYFDKWYRDPKHRIITRSATIRKARLAVSMAEYYLTRPVRSVLDVGCGEGAWFSILNQIRPAIRYTGVDPSAYAIRRFGRQRHLIEGSFGDLPQLRGLYDLIICSDVLYSVSDSELLTGLPVLAAHLSGVAFLEAYPNEEELIGDTAGIHPRTADRYLEIFQSSGFLSCGSHCYVGPSLYDSLTTFESGQLT